MSGKVTFADSLRFAGGVLWCNLFSALYHVSYARPIKRVTKHVSIVFLADPHQYIISKKFLYSKATLNSTCQNVGKGLKYELCVRNENVL